MVTPLQANVISDRKAFLRKSKELKSKEVKEWKLTFQNIIDYFFTPSCTVTLDGVTLLSKIFSISLISWSFLLFLEPRSLRHRFGITSFFNISILMNISLKTSYMSAIWCCKWVNCLIHPMLLFPTNLCRDDTLICSLLLIFSDLLNCFSLATAGDLFTLNSSLLSWCSFVSTMIFVSDLVSSSSINWISLYSCSSVWYVFCNKFSSVLDSFVVSSTILFNDRISCWSCRTLFSEEANYSSFSDIESWKSLIFKSNFSFCVAIISMFSSSSLNVSSSISISFLCSSCISYDLCKQCS